MPNQPDDLPAVPGSQSPRRSQPLQANPQSPGKTVALIVVILVVAALLAAVGVRQRGRKHFGPHVPRPHTQQEWPVRESLFVLDGPATFAAAFEACARREWFS